tara:strand:- start:289 stop:717 length:429 start_codon:yes stop_codon:yes gene_type:complete
MEITLRWLIGFLVALSGNAVIGRFVDWMRNRITGGQWTDDKPPSPISPRLVGIIECLFFTLAVAFDMNGVIVAMVGWITVKMAANWGSRNVPEGMSGDREDFRLSALLGGLVSMGFALVGGLICRGSIWWWPTDNIQHLLRQ